MDGAAYHRQAEDLQIRIDTSAQDLLDLEHRHALIALAAVSGDEDAKAEVVEIGRRRAAIQEEAVTLSAALTELVRKRNAAFDVENQAAKTRQALLAADLARVVVDRAGSVDAAIQNMLDVVADFQRSIRSAQATQLFVDPERLGHLLAATAVKDAIERAGMVFAGLANSEASSLADQTRRVARLSNEAQGLIRRADSIAVAA